MVKNIAAALDTTVVYLLGESKKHEVLNDTAMLKRLNDIAGFLDEDKKHILYTLDGLIKNVKLKAINTIKPGSAGLLYKIFLSTIAA